MVIGTLATYGVTASSEKIYYFVAKPKIAVTTTITSPQKTLYTTEELKQVLSEKVMKYGGNYAEMVRVINCESGFNQNPQGWNDGGKAFGVAQFHKETFVAFSKEMGEPQLNYYNPVDQLEVMVWAFNHQKKSHWSCWTKLINT